MSTVPAVSICIPTYRRPALLREAIASALNQTFNDYEVVVFDDAPSDDTAEAVHSFNDPRIRYIATDTNLRPPRSWNQAVRHANAPLVVLLPDDDRLEPTFLERMTATLNAHPDVAFVQCEVFELSPTGTTTHTPKQRTTLRGDQAVEWHLTDLRCLPVSLLFRKSAMESLGLWREDYWDDWAFIVRLAFRHGFTYIPETLSTLRMHTENLHKKLGTEQRDSILDQINQLSDIFGTALPTTTRLERLRSRLERALSHHSLLLALGALRRRKLSKAVFHFSRARRLNALIPFDPGTLLLLMSLRRGSRRG